MRYVKQLTDGELEKLRKFLRNCPSLNARQRANAIILSSKKFSVAAIADFFEVHRDTISNWLKSWESHGMMGLFDKPKPGRPKFNDE